MKYNNVYLYIHASLRYCATDRGYIEEEQSPMAAMGMNYKRLHFLSLDI